MNKYEDIREVIMLNYDQSYNKLLDPRKTHYTYSQEQLDIYVKYAKLLCDDLLTKFQRLINQKNVYTSMYHSKTISIMTVVGKISSKLGYLLLKLHSRKSKNSDLNQSVEEETNHLSRSSKHKDGDIDEESSLDKDQNGIIAEKEGLIQDKSSDTEIFEE